MNLGISLGLGGRPSGGGGVVGFAATTTVSTTGTSSIVTVPAEAQTGDVILMMGVSNLAGNEVTPPAGWSTPVNTNGISFAHRTHDGSASYTFTVTSSILHKVVLVFFRGFTVGAAGAAWSAAANDPVANSITVPVADSLNVNFVGSVSSGNTYSMPAGWTSRASGSTNRSHNAFERDARVAAGVLAGVTATRTAGAATGRALQVSLSPA